MEEKFCMQCGKANPSNVRFCGACGWEFPGADTGTLPVQPASPPQPRRLSKKWLALIALGALVLVAVIVILALTGSGGSQPPDYGVYLQLKTGLVALRAENFFSYPVISEIKALTATDESPSALLVRLKGGVNPGLLSLRSAGALRGEGKTLNFTTASRGSETLEVKPDSPFANGVYCVFIGNPSAASIPGYCFRVGPAPAQPSATVRLAPTVTVPPTRPAATPTLPQLTVTSTAVPQGITGAATAMKIAVHTLDGTLTIKDASGKVLSTVATNIKNPCELSWSPNGRYVLCFARQPNGTFYLIDTQSRTVKQWTETFKILAYSWSPASDKIIASFDMADQRVLSLEGKTLFSFSGSYAWGLDGQSIFALMNFEPFKTITKFDVARVDASTGKQQVLNPAGRKMTGFDVLDKQRLRFWFEDTVEIYDLAGKQLTPLVKFPNSSFVNLSYSGKYGFFVSEAEKAVYLYNFGKAAQEKISSFDINDRSAIFWNLNELVFYQVHLLKRQMDVGYVGTGAMIPVPAQPFPLLQKQTPFFPYTNNSYSSVQNSWLDEKTWVLQSYNAADSSYKVFLADVGGRQLAELCQTANRSSCAAWAP